MVSIDFNPVPKDKTTIRLATVAMPASPNQEEGYANELQIAVTYNKSGRRGRGYYLSMIGCSLKGFITQHSLMADPAVSLLIEPTKRFSAKTLTKLANAAPVDQLEMIKRVVEHALHYYETKKHGSRFGEDF